MHSLTDIFRGLVRDHMGPKPIETVRSTTVEAAVEAMARTGTALVVTDSQSRPVGILTALDVLRRVGLHAPAHQAVETVMTTPVVTVTVDDHLFQAITTMRRHGLRDVPVVDGAGRLAGLMALDQALLVLSALSVRLVDRLTQDDSADGLRRIKEVQVELGAALLREDAPIADVQALLTHINSDLHRRALVRAIADMVADGWGEPPVAFALIVMGSGGRGESLLDPDQDNGFILADYADADHTRIDAYFVPLAERFTRLLDAIGFPLCVGNVMATNPVWRKRISEWRRQIAIWLRKRTEAQLLLSDILFDFRHVWGDAALSESLRASITQSIARNPAFIRDLAATDATHTAALGWFGRLRSERDRQDRPGMINLKMRGALPLVEAARLLALKTGVPATSTLARLDGLLARGALHPDDHDELKDAFNFISRLLLRQQVESFQAGARIDDFIPEARLSKRERDHLVACFRAIVNLRTVMQAELMRGTF